MLTHCFIKLHLLKACALVYVQIHMSLISIQCQGQWSAEIVGVNSEFAYVF
jgi:hypothetical protein